jgi:glucose-1-phosphate cytidylyltransferase
MKVALLAGGLGTRLREETEFRPKPMVEIGGKPILWHIMRLYAHYGHKDFVLCLGYKGQMIRDYFVNYRTHNCDVTVNLDSRDLEFHSNHLEGGWKVTLAETGEKTMTGGRLQRIQKYIDDDLFMVTYGDGVANVNIDRLLACHRAHGKLATVTAVRPSSRFGELSLEGGLVKTFDEKPQVSNSWINGGFLVMHRSVLDLVEGDEDSLEKQLLIKLADRGQLGVYRHDGFWQCMDTLREMELLNKMWQSGDTPWIPEKDSIGAAHRAA